MIRINLHGVIAVVHAKDLVGLRRKPQLIPAFFLWLEVYHEHALFGGTFFHGNRFIAMVEELGIRHLTRLEARRWCRFVQGIRHERPKVVYQGNRISLVLVVDVIQLLLHLVDIEF